VSGGSKCLIFVKGNLTNVANVVVSECRPTVRYRVVTNEILRDYFLHFISEVLAPKISPANYGFDNDDDDDDDETGK